MWTSGVVVVTKDQASAQKMHDLFRWAGLLHYNKLPCRSRPVKRNMLGLSVTVGHHSRGICNPSSLLGEVSIWSPRVLPDCSWMDVHVGM